MILDEGRPADRGFGGLRDFSRLLGRHKLLVALPILVGLIGAIEIFVATPKGYVATAVVALDVRKVTVVPGDLVVSRLPQENPALRTELDILGSRSMAERVILRRGAETLAPLLTGRSGIAGWRRSLSAAFHHVTATVLAMVGAGPSPGEAVAARTPRQAHEDLVDSIIDGVHAGNDSRSYTIHISFTADDPSLAAAIANTYAEEYLAHQTALKLEAMRTASDWLGKKVEEMRGTLENAEQAVETFRRQAGLFDIGGTSIEDHRLDVLNAELVRARASAAEARARLETATGLAREADGVATFTEALKSPTVVALRDQQAALLRESQGLQDMGAVKSARLPAIQSQLRTLSEQVGHEVDRVLKSLENEVQVAERRVQDTERAIQTEIAASGRANQATIHLNQLEREATASRTLFETFLNRYKAIIEQDDLASPDAQLISRAQPPSAPATPKLLPLLALGLILGTAGGIGAAYLREHYDDRVWSADVLEERSGLPVLGAVPSHRQMMANLRPAGGPEPSLTDGQASSLQRLQAVLRLYPGSRTAKVIAFTSALLGEGKTFLSIAVARASAAAGESVLVVEADVHHPSLAARLGLKPAFRWEELISGEKSIDDVLQRDSLSGAFVLAAGPSPAGATTPFATPAFTTLVAVLRQRFDRIIIDTPPVSASADAAILGAIADVTLLVVRWRRTTYNSVIETLRQMALCSAPVAGIVLNQIDARSSARYAACRSRPSPRQPVPVEPIRPSRAPLRRA